MPARHDFERQLDDNPSDWVLRLIYADWLEEQGDNFAEAQRWMAENKKCPEYRGAAAGEWAWWDARYSLPALIDEHDLPAGFGVRKDGLNSVHFDSRQTAEQWLYEQLTRSQEA